jgi:hypothetical protein
MMKTRPELTCIFLNSINPSIYPLESSYEPPRSLFFLIVHCFHENRSHEILSILNFNRNELLILPPSSEKDRQKTAMGLKFPHIEWKNFFMSKEAQNIISSVHVCCSKCSPSCFSYSTLRTAFSGNNYHYVLSKEFPTPGVIYNQL